MPIRLLVVDDDPQITSWVKSVATEPRYHVESASTNAEAVRLLAERRPHLTLIDEILPDGTGLWLLKTIREQYAEVATLFLATTRDPALPVEAMRHGAIDCLRKPIDLSEFRAVLTSVEPKTTNRRQRAGAGVDTSADELVAETDSMLAALKELGRAASSRSPIHFCGEAGTGKETLARLLHASNEWTDGGRFEVLFCPGLNDADFESRLEELTRSTQVRRPLSTAPRWTTILLQEVGTLTFSMQTRLLTMLETIAHANTDSATPCRVLSTSTQELADYLQEGKLRPDLFYALTVHLIRLPALRERTLELPLLVRRFLAQEQAATPLARLLLTPESIQKLTAFSWPGNLDELRSFVRRCNCTAATPSFVADCLGQLARPVTASMVDADDVDATDAESFRTDWRKMVAEGIRDSTSDLYAEAISETEGKLLRLVLEYTQGNQAQASRILGITRASLRKKLRAISRPCPDAR